MSNKLVTRTLQILGQATSEVGKEYFSNTTAFVNDAKDVRNAIVKVGTDASDTFAKIKSTNVTKAIHDWFYNEENSMDADLGMDTEFDAGFKVDSSDDSSSGEETSKVLNVDTMSDISKKQTSTLLKIGRRQNEQSVANTAEIISVVNTRTSEMVTAMNNINKTLLGINDKLDKIIKIQTVGVTEEDKTESKEIDKDGLFDDGRLSLMRIFEQSKKGLGSNMVMQLLGQGKDYLTSGVLTPKALAKMGIELGLNNIKIDGTSISEIGHKINDSIGATIQTAMNEMINTKTFKNIFGDITQFVGDKNYAETIKSTYDKKRATFDGMTRYSIVNVIPEMLANINESISGVKYRLDNNGKWVSGPMKNEFVEVTNNTFVSSGIGTRTTRSIAESFKNSSIGQEIPTEHVEVAGKALTMAIISVMFKTNSRSFTMSQLNGDMSTYINIAVPPLCMLGINPNPDYWAMVCQTIIIKLGSGIMDASKFISNINQSLQNTIREAGEFAQSGKMNASQATVITGEMITNQFIKENRVQQSSTVNNNNTGSSNNNNSSSSNNDQPLPPGKIKGADGRIYDINSIDGRIASNDKIKRGEFEAIDYLHGIFGILNRGINVAVEKNIDHYGNYSMKRISVEQEYTDNKAGQMFKDFFSGNKDALQDSIKAGMEKAVGSNTTELISTIRKQGVTMAASNMLGRFGGDMITKFFNGETGTKLTDKVKGIKDSIVGKAQGMFDSAKDAASDKYNELKYDRRYNELRRTIEGVPDKAKDVVEDAKDVATGAYHYANDKANDFVDRHKGLRKIKNNLLYRKDSAALAYAQDRFSNLETDREALSNLSETDKNRFIAITRSVNKGNLNDRVSRAIDRVEDESARNLLRSNFDTIDSITKKRKKGEADVAAGKVADIGAVMDDSKSKAGKIFDVVKSGFKNVGGLLGKIAKGIAGLAKSGLLDIRYGLQSIKEGLIGYSDRDENGKKTQKHNGMLQTAFKTAFAPVAGVVGLGKLAAKGVGSLAKGYLDKEVDVKDENGNTTKMTRREKLRNKKISYDYEYDEKRHDFGEAKFGRKFNEDGKVDEVNGTKRSYGFSTYSRAKDENGKSKKTNVVTVGDVIDAPGKALAQTLKNIGSQISKSGLGSAVKAVSGTLKKLGDNVKGVISKIKGTISEFGDAIKKIPGIEGFTKGFTRAKEAKKEAERKANAKKYREEHPSVANIEDSLFKNPDSFLGKIHNKFDDLITMLKEYHKEDMDAAEEAEENADKRAEEANSNNTDNGSTINGSPDISAVNSTGDTPAPSSGEGEGEGSSGGGLKGVMGKAGNFLKDAINSIGQTLGGVAQTMLGVFKVVVSIVSGLSAFKAIQEMITSIWQDGIKPLNKGLMTLKKALMPVVQTLKSAVRTIAQAVSKIFSTLVKVFQPLLEIVQNAVGVIMNVLSPIFDLLDGALGGILPIIGKAIIKAVPAIEMIADLVEFAAGILTFGIGSVLILMGEILSGIGSGITIVSGFLDKLTLGLLGKVLKGDEIGRKIKDVGDNFGSSGNDLISSAKTLFSEATANLKSHFFEFINPPDPAAVQEPVDLGKVDTTQVRQRDEMGAGNVNTNTVNNSWTYMYGSGNTSSMNQHNYGGYMNMSERGCGPVAMADAFTRRTGVGISPAAMARTMAGSGNYDPRRGASVGSMMSTASALGMGMRLGGVTQSSLNQATPSNPITLLGSGPGFGTKAGNNHYVNVVGTDAMGGAYVSNPMSGRIERHSKSQLALNSKLGLYGSGDNENEMYDIADTYGMQYETADALKKLKELSERLTAMFVGDSGAVAAKKEMEAEQNAIKAKKIKDKLGDEYAAVEEQAKAELRKNYPKRDGETDEAYEARIARLWQEKGDQYIIKYGAEAATIKNDQMFNDIEGGVNTLHEGVQQSLKSMQQMHPGGAAFVGAVMSDYDPINYYQTDIYGTDSDRSAVHDYFSATSGYHAHTMNGGWFKKINDPNKYGEGTKGNKHEGLSLWFDTDEYEDSPEVHAITKGTVVYVGRNGEHGKSDKNGGLGNHVKFIDASGMYHWFLHLNDIDESIQEGSNIDYNQLIGHVGSTGATGNDDEGKPNKYLRYILTRSGPFGKTDDKGYENPLKYWDWYDPGEIPGTNASIENASGSITAGANGPALASVEGGYTYTDVDMDDVYDDSMQNHPVPGSVSGVATYGRHASKHSPVLEFFQKTQPDNAVAYVDSSGYGHWFWNRGEPDKYGKGQKNMGTGLDSGENSVEHGGVDIRWEGGSAGRELHATTGGTVKFVYDAASYSAGNQVGWEDSAGKVHWYIHMRDLPLVKTGDKIEPGQLLGYAGQSGSTSGGYDHLHYTIIDPEYAGVSTSNPNSGMENPIAYFTNFSPTASGTGSAGNADYSTPETGSTTNVTKSALSSTQQKYLKQQNVDENSHPSQWKNLSDSKRSSIFKTLASHHNSLCDKSRNWYHEGYASKYKNAMLNNQSASSEYYWKYGYEMVIKGRDGQSIQSFIKHHDDLMSAWNFVDPQAKVKYGMGGPNDTKDMLFLSSSGEIPLSAEMSRAQDWWTAHEDELSSAGYWEKAAKAGLTAGQQAMVAAIGIHEDGAEKLIGKKSLTAITHDVNGQAAVGLMNWIPQNPSGGEDKSFGTTLEEQLKTVVDWYMSSNPKHARAKVMENFNSYKDAMKNAMGYEPKLGIGDLWGQYADKDVVEAMGHYVGNALVPHDWNLTTGQARHMRTAAMAYNWGLKNGKLSGNQTGTTSAGTANYGGSKSKPRFIASMSNYLGGDWISVGQGGGVSGSSSAGGTNGAGGVEAVIQSAIEVADALNTTNPDASYKNSNGELEYRDGSKQSGFRADCSGYTGEILRHMGYYGDASGNYIIDPSQITGQKMGSPTIYDSSGNITTDWISMKYDKSKLQRGDILYQGVGDGSAHTDMFMLDDNGWSRGFNMGNTSDMQSIMKVSKKYLDDGGGNIDQMLIDAKAGSMPSASQTPTTILRYAAGGTTSAGNADYSLSGGTASEKDIWNALIKGGLSPEQAAGMMGNFTHESGLRSNNLQDSYESSLGYDDEGYTKAVNNKKYSKNSFMHDDAGYGLAQWTYYTGKQHLYEKTVEKGKSIDDVGAQIDLALTEYPSITSGLKQQKTVRDATLYWMNEYERPGIPATDSRLNAANKYYNMFRTSAGNANYGTGGPVDSISYFTSMAGAKMAPFGDPTHKTTNITSGNSGESPVHDFFGATSGKIGDAFSGQGNWYALRNDPDKTGKGSSGDVHSGIDINWSSGSEGKEVHAITGGVVDQAQGGGFNGSGSNGGCGNNIRWIDNGGYMHWYMHMRDDPLAKAGDTIKPGQLLGYVGNTGNSFGAHLHYNVNKSEGFDGWSSSNAINPLTYWSGYDENGSYMDGSADSSASSGSSSMVDAIDTDRMLKTRKLSGAALNAKERGGFSSASFWDGNSEYTDNPDEHMSYDEIAEILNNLEPDLSDIYAMTEMMNSANMTTNNDSSSGSSSSSSSISSGASSSSNGSSSGGKVLQGDSFIDNFINDTYASATESALMSYAKQQTKSSREKNEEAQIKKIQSNNKVGSASSAVISAQILANRTPSMPFNIFDPYVYKIQTPDNRTKAFNELNYRFDIVRGWGKKYSDGPNVTYSGKNIPGIYHASRTHLNTLRKLDGGIQNVKDRLKHDNTLFSSAEDWHYSYLANSSSTHQDRNNHAYDMYDFPDYVKKLKVSYYSGSGDSPSEVSSYVPPLDISNLYDDYSTQQVQPVVVQNYEISRDDSYSDNVLNKMSSMTFNVRAEKVEQLLEQLIKTVENGQKEKNEPILTNGFNQNLFNNEIPSQISRLARG